MAMSALEKLREAQKAWEEEAQGIATRLTGQTSQGLHWRVGYTPAQAERKGPLRRMDGTVQTHPAVPAYYYYIEVHYHVVGGVLGAHHHTSFLMEELQQMQVALDFAQEENFTQDDLKRIYRPKEL